MKAFFTWSGHRWITLLARLYLSYLFIYASIHKIADPSSFALDIATYQFLPLALVNITALILPWVEIISGGMLLIGFRTRAAALLVAGMMIIFIVALAWALYLGLDMSCGCFASSSSKDPISSLTLLRDGAWLALALYVFFFDGPKNIGVDGIILSQSA